MKEMKSLNYGDVIFPIPEDYFSESYKTIVSKKEIRNEYFLEIRNILNGYSSRNHEACDESFIDYFNQIKGLTRDDDGRLYEWDWLNTKPVKRVIKAWKGQPLDVLEYLTHHGYIEKAVRQECKTVTAK
jgi:hypothetical protein